MKNIITIVVTGLLCITLLAGCNTVKGVGQDVSSGGHALQRAAS